MSYRETPICMVKISGLHRKLTVEEREIAIETARMINTEITVEIRMKLDEIKPEPNSQLLGVRNLVITEQVLHPIPNTLCVQGRGTDTGMDRMSSEIHGSLEVVKKWKNGSRSNFKLSSRCHTTRESSKDHQRSEQILTW